MTRSRLTWLLGVPLAAAGSWFAHAASYRLVVPDGERRGALLAETGHGYLDFAPALAALGLALVAVALLLRVRTSARRGDATRLLCWPFALLPPLYFGLQEHLERFVHTGAFPSSAALEPTFVVGLLLQIPFALAAFALARLLLKAVDRLGCSLDGRSPRRVHGAAPAMPAPGIGPVLRPAVAARGYGERGPPGLL